jgi:hypothetical protein
MRNRDARIAGALYLLSIVAGVFDLKYIPRHFAVTGNAAATAHNILANQMLFRLGMAADLVAGVVWLFVPLALCKLLKDVDGEQAALMVILGTFMQVPLYFVNVVNYAAAFLLVNGASYLTVFSSAQRNAMALFFLRLHHYELLSSLVFAGLWLFPFGVLVFKSGFLPRTLGVWLVLNGSAWLAVSFTGFVAPQYGDAVDAVTLPFTFGEIAITAWLLIFGAKILNISGRQVTVG